MVCVWQLAMDVLQHHHTSTPEFTGLVGWFFFPLTINLIMRFFHSSVSLHTGTYADIYSMQTFSCKQNQGCPNHSTKSRTELCKLSSIFIFLFLAGRNEFPYINLDVLGIFCCILWIWGQHIYLDKYSKCQMSAHAG